MTYKILMHSFAILKISFILITSSFTAFGMEQNHYGIGIEDTFWGQRADQKGFRVIFMDVVRQRVLDVNYYTPQNGTGVYNINSDQRHSHNPLRGFMLIEGNEKHIIVSPEFTLNFYTVITHFPLYKLNKEIKDISTVNPTNDLELLNPAAIIMNGKVRKYANEGIPHSSVILSQLFTALDSTNFRITHTPTFRLLDMTGHTPPRVSHVHEEALEEKGEAKYYSLKKEEMGEITAILTIASYAFKLIFDTKISGIFGMDIIFATGENPLNDELFLAEAKWTCDKTKPATFLNKELNKDKIIDRIIKMNNKTLDTPDAQKALIIIRNFFSTAGAKIFKMMYRVLDNKEGTNRGTVRPYFERIQEDERIHIATAVGFIIKQPLINMQTDLVSPFNRLAISPTVSPQQRNETSTQLYDFISFIDPQYHEEIFAHLSEKYSLEYQKWKVSK